MSDTNEQEIRASEEQLSDDALESVAGGIVAGLLPVIKGPGGPGDCFLTVEKTIVITPTFPTEPDLAI